MQGCLSHINAIHQGSNSTPARHKQFHSLGVATRTLSARIHETLIWVGANLHLQHLVRGLQWLFPRLWWRRQATTRWINGLGCRCRRCKLSSLTDEDVPFVSPQTHRLPAIFISVWYDRLLRCIVSAFIHPLRVWTHNCIEQKRRGGWHPQVNCAYNIKMVVIW